MNHKSKNTHHCSTSVVQLIIQFPNFQRNVATMFAEMATKRWIGISMYFLQMPPKLLPSKLPCELFLGRLCSLPNRPKSMRRFRRAVVPCVASAIHNFVVDF
mmetsp:Transcript_25914/g.53004  ORF Transcript_25914/g.53004 Transcript_25914/m.53004 type:complete len:102 (+) Transcript_25914:38-343(+)